ncbi:hypothetical protein MTR67_002198 [Solanum verrucosum]|uniref:Uncharacterized protein n=1 Tax=Solanum verrucosum TaxID=315347 RepID=A0AAF0T957_SOLVR|nr:hypothetical protein MTR67_002198 [Solanum verrucosum]
MTAPGSSPIASYGRTHVLLHPLCQRNDSGCQKNAPSVTQPSQIVQKRSILERFFFSFMISSLFPLRFAFSRIQILNSWSPNRL